MLSHMARVYYSYEDRYLLTASIRRDGSSRFGKTHRWGTFPSVSVAWRASQEKWFPKNDYINDLKVRAGYGVTGSQASVGNYSYLASDVYKRQAVCKFLGDISYPIYITHYPLVYTYTAWVCNNKIGRAHV